VRPARLLLAFLLVAAAAGAGVREVELSLPVRAKLALTGREKIFIGPFLREIKGDEAAPKLGFSVEAEFERELRRLLRKEAKFILLPAVDGLRPPSSDPLELSRASEFWRELGTRTGADYIVAGSIDFTIEERSGYKQEEYQSPLDGRTYYRQVLVEQTGFTYDILLQVYDARTGAVVHEEPLKDFHEVQEANVDEFSGMFANLYSLENQVVNIFVPRTVKTKRQLLLP
jgi:hypothetical protein